MFVSRSPQSPHTRYHVRSKSNHGHHENLNEEQNKKLTLWLLLEPLCIIKPHGFQFLSQILQILLSETYIKLSPRIRRTLRSNWHLGFLLCIKWVSGTTQSIRRMPMVTSSLPPRQGFRLLTPLSMLTSLNILSHKFCIFLLTKKHK